MARNYDTTDSKPYTRVDEFTVKYEQGFVTLSITESESVVLGGKVRRIADSTRMTTFGLPLTVESVTAPVPVIDPRTGVATGQQTTMAEVIALVTSMIRTKQLERDAAEALAQG